MDESISQSIRKIHVIQSPSRCYFAAALTNLFLFAAQFEERLGGFMASMIVYLFEKELVKQTVQVSIFNTREIIMCVIRCLQMCINKSLLLRTILLRVLRAAEYKYLASK